MTYQQRLETAIKELYEMFSRYLRPQTLAFCTFCYDKGQLEHLDATPLKELDPEITRLLIWEASDHFGSTDVYKHFLPRILEHLAPPVLCEDIYPEHLFETLEAHNFSQWPSNKSEAFWTYAVAMAETLGETNRRAAREWRMASRKLPGSPFLNDDAHSIDPE